jgi:hypothetical protein
MEGAPLVSHIAGYGRSRGPHGVTIIARRVRAEAAHARLCLERRDTLTHVARTSETVRSACSEHTGRTVIDGELGDRSDSESDD